MSLDAKIMAEIIAKMAGLAIVDAHCSGQSLLAKRIANPGCFHPAIINKNANRQKIILANSAQLVARLSCLYDLYLCDRGKRAGMCVVSEQISSVCASSCARSGSISISSDPPTLLSDLASIWSGCRCLYGPVSQYRRGKKRKHP